MAQRRTGRALILTHRNQRIDVDVIRHPIVPDELGMRVDIRNIVSASDEASRVSRSGRLGGRGKRHPDRAPARGMRHGYVPPKGLTAFSFLLERRPRERAMLRRSLPQAEPTQRRFQVPGTTKLPEENNSTQARTSKEMVSKNVKTEMKHGSRKNSRLRLL